MREKLLKEYLTKTHSSQRSQWSNEIKTSALYPRRNKTKIGKRPKN